MAGVGSYRLVVSRRLANGLASVSPGRAAPPELAAVGGRDDVVDVTRILVMSETLPLAQVKSKFSEMVDRVEHTHDRIIVTRNGRPAAVMISPDDLASLEDTLELLSDPDAMRELAEAKRAAADGDYITGDELRSRFSSP
jgi:antitoxin YefM